MRYWAYLGIYAAVSLAFLVSGVTIAQEDERYDRCLDYFSVGPSGCVPAKKEKGSKAKPAPKPVAQAPAAKPTSVTEIPIEPEYVEEKPKAAPSMDERIDEFIENHGKPPREFVAFHLEPTLENALKWVHAYNEMIERQQLLTYAWSQAERVYDESVSEGTDPSVLNAKDTLSAVPDYGVELADYPNPHNTGITEPVHPRAAQPQNNQGITLPANTVPPRQPGFLAPGVPAGFITKALQARQEGQGAVIQAKAQGVSNRATPLVGGSIGGGSASGAMQLSYYFSAECPYCQKFEPGFQSLVKELGSKVQVTCVDMTPSGPKRSNIAGKVDCAWRSIRKGELQKMGIQRTPTVIISRGGGQALERVSGYVEPLKLKEYLLTGEVR